MPVSALAPALSAKQLSARWSNMQLLTGAQARTLYYRSSTASGTGNGDNNEGESDLPAVLQRAKGGLASRAAESSAVLAVVQSLVACTGAAAAQSNSNNLNNSIHAPRSFASMPSMAQPAVMPEDTEFVADLAIVLNFIFTAEASALHAGHCEFKSLSTFALPSNGGANVEKCFAGVCQYIIERMQDGVSQQVCKVPSSFVIRLLWTQLVYANIGSAETSRYKSSGRDGNAAGGGGDTTVDGNSVAAAQAAQAAAAALQKEHKAACDSVTASLITDAAYFSGFVRQAIEAQLVLEYLSYSAGLLD